MESEDLLKRVAQSEAWPGPPEGPCLSQQVLTAFRSGSLDSSSLEMAEKHLSSCAFCTDRLIRIDMPLPQLSPQARRTLYTRLEQSSTPAAARWSWWWSAGMGMAATALLLLMLVRGQHPEETAHLGGYQLYIQGEVQAVRGTSHASASREVKLTPESLLRIQLLPENETAAKDPGDGLPQVGLYVDDGHGGTERITGPLIPERDAPTGMLTVQGVVKTLLPGKQGSLRLYILLMPNKKTLPPALEEGGVHEGQLLEQTLIIEGSTP